MKLSSIDAAVDVLDVLIIGAGPAGATAALNLAPTRSVLLVDSSESRSPFRIGESLIPAARRLFADMGLLAPFAAQGHLPCYGNRSVWGSETPAETDWLRDPDGHGWHLDRARFDSWLRAVAVERGAGIVCDFRLRSIETEAGGRGWYVVFSGPAGRPIPVYARTLIDATGRSASIARRFGSRRESAEPAMLCAWVHGAAMQETPATAGFTAIEAVEDGWWYTAPVPNGARVVAFHTDRDLPARQSIGSTKSLMQHAKGAPFLMATLEECGLTTDGVALHWIAASGGISSPPAGPHWFAAGDAAVHFDPLSSQGLFNALFTGLACAEAADRLLDGADPQIVAEGYATLIDGIRQAYLTHRLEWYLTEHRWRNSLFWHRRHEESNRLHASR